MSFFRFLIAAITLCVLGCAAQTQQNPIESDGNGQQLCGAVEDIIVHGCAGHGRAALTNPSFPPQVFPIPNADIGLSDALPIGAAPEVARLGHTVFKLELSDGQPFYVLPEAPIGHEYETQLWSIFVGAYTSDGAVVTPLLEIKRNGEWVNAEYSIAPLGGGGAACQGMFSHEQSFLLQRLLPYEVRVLAPGADTIFVLFDPSWQLYFDQTNGYRCQSVVEEMLTSIATPALECGAEPDYKVIDGVCMPSCGQASRNYYGANHLRGDDTAEEQRAYLACVDSGIATGDSLDLGNTHDCTKCILVWP